jgi:hypothetical protein
MIIDSGEITDIVFEEAHLLAERFQFDDTPELSPDKKFEKLVSIHQLPEPKYITLLIDEIFWASLLTDEGRPCRPRLLFSPRQDSRRRAVHRLAKPIPLSREALRKLAPVQGPFGYLTWDSTSGVPEITGVQGREGGDPCDFIVAAPKNGALDFSWACARVLTLRAGRLDRFSQSCLPEVRDALEIVRKLTGSFEPVFLDNAVRAIANVGHGGSIWILREGCLIDTIHLGYPVRSDDCALLQQPYEQRRKWLESLGYLAAGDGAVVVDSRVRVLGFGAFIDVPEAARPVTFVSYEAGAKSISSTELGGGRHRSALEFCVRFAPAAAIVVSEDGRISIMWAETQGAPYCAPFSALGVISDTII